MDNHAYIEFCVTTSNPQNDFTTSVHTCTVTSPTHY